MTPNRKDKQVKRSVVIATIVVVLLAALWAGATYWFGVKAEQQYRAWLQQATPSPYLKFVNESYTRGFSTSQARTVMEIQTVPGASAANPPLKITLAHDITHGPLPFGKSADGTFQFKPLLAIIETRLLLKADSPRELTELYVQVPEVQSMKDHTMVYLNGHGEEHFVIPAFKRSFGDADKVAVDWQGLSLQVNFSADFKRFTASLNAPGVEAVGKDGRLKIKDVKSGFKVEEGLGGLSLGEVSFELGGLEFAEQKPRGTQSLLIGGFKTSASNQAVGDNVNCSVAIRTEQVKLDEAQYGPGVLEMEFRNLDAASLARLQQIARDAQMSPPQQSPDQLKMMMLARYAEVLPNLLKKSPEVEISKLEIKTPEGDFTGKAKLTFDGTKSGGSANLLALVGAIAAQAEFKVAERLLHHLAAKVMKDQIVAEKKQREGSAPSDQEIRILAAAAVDGQLKTLLTREWIVKDQDHYRATASYKAGEIIVNGRQVSLQNLLQ
jgi:uncharacterized protein YdgA (DUF945 family)